MEQAADALEEDHPEISSYLRSLTDPTSTTTSNSQTQDLTNPNATEVDVSALAVDEYTSQQTSSLLEDTKRIMEEAERDGTDPDERLREVVERAVRQGFSFGGQLGDAAGSGSALGTGQTSEVDGQVDTKRTREGE